MSLSTTPNLSLIPPGEGDSTTSPGKLFSCLTNLSEKKLLGKTNIIIPNSTSHPRLLLCPSFYYWAWHHMHLCHVCLWSVWVSCSGCNPSQLLVHPQSIWLQVPSGKNTELFLVTPKMHALLGGVFYTSICTTCYTQGNTDICMLINCKTAGKIPAACLPCRVYNCHQSLSFLSKHCI